MIRLILVRHGETDSSKAGTYCGWSDIELNDEGICQAYRLKEKLKNTKVDAFYCSPLKRALQTAEIINEGLNMDIVCSESLKERSFGIWEDLSYRQISEKYPDELGLWQKDWANYCIRDGESAFQVHSRVVAFVDGLIAKREGTFLMVTHLGCIRSILSHLLGLGMEGQWRFRTDSGSITRVDINDEGFAYLTALNV